MTESENKRQARVSVSLSGHAPSESTVSCRSGHGYITPQWERVEKGATHMERYPTQYCLLKGEEIEVPFLWKCVNGNEEDKLFFNIFSFVSKLGPYHSICDQ